MDGLHCLLFIIFPVGGFFLSQYLPDRLVFCVILSVMRSPDTRRG